MCSSLPCYTRSSAETTSHRFSQNPEHQVCCHEKRYMGASGSAVDWLMWKMLNSSAQVTDHRKWGSCRQTWVWCDKWHPPALISAPASIHRLQVRGHFSFFKLTSYRPLCVCAHDQSFCLCTMCKNQISISISSNTK